MYVSVKRMTKPYNVSGNDKMFSEAKWISV